MVVADNGGRVICHNKPQVESRSVSVSSTGKFVFIVSGTSSAYYLYKSDNFGDSFNQVLSGLTYQSIVQISDSGQYVAVSGGSTSNIYTSSDLGNTFQSNTYTSSSSLDFKVSGSGQYLFSDAKYSTSFGQSWNSWSSLFGFAFTGVGSTKDGKFVLGIYDNSGQAKGKLSSDYGNSFTTVGIIFFLILLLINLTITSHIN